MRNLFLVCYDISADKPRRKIEKLLTGYGKRVQYSVFECLLTLEKKKELVRRLKEMYDVYKADPATDSVRIYRNCEFCRGQIDKIGLDKSMKDEYMII